MGHQTAVLANETLVQQPPQVLVALSAPLQTAETVLRQIMRVRVVRLLLVAATQFVLLLAQELLDAGQYGHLVEFVLDAHILRKIQSDFSAKKRLPEGIFKVSGHQFGRMWTRLKMDFVNVRVND